MVLSQVDWYFYNVGPFHVTQAVNQSIAIMNDERVLRWWQCNDRVLLRSVGISVGAEELQKLIPYFTQRSEFLAAAKVQWTLASINQKDYVAHEEAALSLLVQADSTHEVQQLEVSFPPVSCSFLQ